MFSRSVRLPLPVLSRSFCLRFAATKGKKSHRSVNVAGERGDVERPAERVNNGIGDVSREIGAAAVAWANNYNVREARTLVRGSKDFAISKALPPHVKDVLVLQESLSPGRQRNTFIFSFGAAVVLDIRVGENACTSKLRDFLSELGESQFLACPPWLDYLTFRVDARRAKSGLTNETVIFAARAPGEVASMDQLALSHALAMSIKLRAYEEEVDQITQKCRLVYDQAFSSNPFKWFRKRPNEWDLWQHASEVKDEVAHLPDGADDYYWDYPPAETLFDEIMDDALDYRRRTAEINSRLEYALDGLQYVHDYRRSKSSRSTSLAILCVLLFAVIYQVLPVLLSKIKTKNSEKVS